MVFVAEKVQEALAKGRTYDFTNVRLFLAREKGYSEEEMLAMQEEYLKYMAIRAGYPEQCTAISAGVDPFWHAHIVFTEAYAEFCEDVCGYFVNHRPPMEGEDELLKASYLENTLRFYEGSFGELTALWPRDGEAAVCTDDDYSWSPAVR